MSTAVLALIDPSLETAYRNRLVREAYEAGRERGYGEGVEAMAGAYKRGLKRAYVSAQREAARWTVLCRPCRLNGRREGCTRCEIRTPATYGQPHPDDFVPARRAAA